MTINDLFITKIDGTDVIQDGESVLTVENKQSTYNNPFSQNNTVDLGAGLEKIEMSFKVISQSNKESILESFRNTREIVIVDKFKGQFNVFVEKFSLKESDKTIGIAFFKVTLKVIEELAPPTQDLGSQLTEDSETLDDMVPANVDLESDNISVLDSIKEGIQKAVTFVEDAFKVVDSSLRDYASFVESVEAFKTNIEKLASLPSLYADLLGRLTDRITGLFEPDPSDSKEVRASKAKQKQSILATITPFESIPTSQDDPDASVPAGKQPGLTSSFVQIEARNSNVTSIAFNLALASIQIGGLPDVQFTSQEEAKEVQEALLERLTSLEESDQLVTETVNADNEDVVLDLRQIKVNVANYIQALDVPAIVEIEVKNKPIFVLAYELYEDITRADEIKQINNLVFTDNITGTLQVLSR
jgi:prophage DNA circulation protein